MHVVAFCAVSTSWTKTKIETKTVYKDLFINRCLFGYIVSRVAIDAFVCYVFLLLLLISVFQHHYFVYAFTINK